MRKIVDETMKEQEEFKEYYEIMMHMKEIHLKIMKHLRENPQSTIVPLYKGWVPFYSQLIINPKFLFIGINPGAGAYVEKPIESFSYVDEFEYTNDAIVNTLDDYKLAKDTRYLFKGTDFVDELKYSVKINHYSIVSTNQTELNKLRKGLNRIPELNIDILSRDWTMRLIKLIKPEIIICEGKESFNRLVAFYDLSLQKSEKDVFYAVNDTYKVVGYSRLFSNIKNRDGMKKLLQTVVQN